MTYVFSHGYSIRSGFPHSDIGGSQLFYQLPTAFRRLPRPSSPVIAKASTTCTCSLDPITGVSVVHPLRDSPAHRRYTLSFSVVQYSNCRLATALRYIDKITTLIHLRTAISN